MTHESKIITGVSLQGFFYSQLQEFNKISLNPVKQEAIFYSSMVMNSFEDSAKLFEQVGNRTREKILGIKLMESSQLPMEKQKIVLKDIAETSLITCGFFHDSMNRKILDARYYEDIGRIAYTRLNSFSPIAYDVPSFFKMMANNFSDVTLLLSLVQKKYSSASDPAMPWLIVKERMVV